MVKEGEANDDSELAEFRGGPPASSKVSVPSASESVREELAVSTVSSSSNEEILADDDFMQELDNM